MNKLSALALGTALTLSMPLAAYAQDADAGVTLDGGVTTELGGDDSNVDAGVDTGVDAGVEAEGEDGEAGVGVDAGADADVGVDADTDGGEMSTEVGAEAGADAGASVDTPDQATLMAALEGTADFDVSAVDASSTINVVAISEIDADQEAWTQAWAEHEADVTAKHGDIEANADISAALEAEGYTAEDVVAIHGEAGADVWVFVDA